MSSCNTCGADYGRNRLSSLAILLRGLRLCGQPFAVSADTSWRLMRDEYLYAPAAPDSRGAGWTEEAANAPNENVYTKYMFEETVGLHIVLDETASDGRRYEVEVAVEDHQP